MFYVSKIHEVKQPDGSTIQKVEDVKSFKTEEEAHDACQILNAFKDETHVVNTEF
jgi:hypothetical protein